MKALIKYECMKILTHRVCLIAIIALFLVPFFFTRQIVRDEQIIQHFDSFSGVVDEQWIARAETQIQNDAMGSERSRYLYTYLFMKQQEPSQTFTSENQQRLDQSQKEFIEVYGDIQGYESILLGLGGSAYLLMLVIILCMHDLCFKEDPYLDLIQTTTMHHEIWKAKLYTAILVPLVLWITFLLYWFIVSGLRFGFGPLETNMQITGGFQYPIKSLTYLWEHSITYLCGMLVISLICAVCSILHKSQYGSLSMGVMLFYVPGMLPLAMHSLLPYYYLQNGSSLAYQSYIELNGQLMSTTCLNIVISILLCVVMILLFAYHYRILKKPGKHPAMMHTDLQASIPTL